MNHRFTIYAILKIFRSAFSVNVVPHQHLAYLVSVSLRGTSLPGTFHIVPKSLYLPLADCLPMLQPESLPLAYNVPPTIVIRACFLPI